MQKILVVDDEKAILDIVSRYLVKEGYKVFSANNG
ncbi:MAG: DNA-binding response regulator, partial [Enterococcus sp.]